MTARRVVGVVDELRRVEVEPARPARRTGCRSGRHGSRCSPRCRESRRARQLPRQVRGQADRDRASRKGEEMIHSLRTSGCSWSRNAPPERRHSEQECRSPQRSYSLVPLAPPSPDAVLARALASMSASERAAPGTARGRARARPEEPAQACARQNPACSSAISASTSGTGPHTRSAFCRAQRFLAAGQAIVGFSSWLLVSCSSRAPPCRRPGARCSPSTACRRTCSTARRS